MNGIAVSAEAAADEKCQEPAEEVEAGSQRGAILCRVFWSPSCDGKIRNKKKHGL